MNDINIPSDSLDEWLKELKPYQKSGLQELMRDLDPEDAAKHWITSTGSQNIVPFGGTKDKEPFWDQFKTEFNKFICDDNSYVEEKKELKSESPVTKTLLISTISAAIGATIGYTATLLAPAVAIMLCTVGKISKNAYCKSVKF